MHFNLFYHVSFFLYFLIWIIYSFSAPLFSTVFYSTPIGLICFKIFINRFYRSAYRFKNTKIKSEASESCKRKRTVVFVRKNERTLLYTLHPVRLQ